MINPQENSRKRMGCWVMPTLTSLFLLGLGCWMLSAWATLPAMGRVVALMLTILGSVILIPVILWTLAVLWIKRTFGGIAKDFKDMAAQGRKLIDLNKTLYGSPHTFRAATPEDFEDLRPAFYDDSTATLSANGFRHVGDVIDETIADAGMDSPVIRLMLASPPSPEGQPASTYVGFFDLSAMEDHGLADAPKGVFDFTTEFSDGTFLVTSNTGSADVTTPPPQLARRTLPSETPVLEILKTHEEEKARLLAEKPGLQALTVTTKEDLLEAEKRQQLIKNAFRQGIGYSDPDEIRRAAQSRGMDKDAADLAATIVEDAKRTPPGNPA